MPADSSVRRNALIGLYGSDFGPDIVLAREVWCQAARDAKQLQRGKLPDNYHNDMEGVKGQLTTRHGPQLKKRAEESIDEFLYCPDNEADRELWAMLGFGVPAEDLARRISPAPMLVSDASDSAD